MAKLLEGKPLVQEMKSLLRQEVEAIKNKTSKPVLLASIATGDNAAVKLYSNAQKKAAEELGIEYELHTLDKDIPEAKLIAYIQKLNNQDPVNGIIVQMPLPAHIDYKTISQCIAVNKDVEGLHPANIGKIVFGQAKLIPCAPAAVMELLKATGVDLYGKDAVIVGHSEIVGKPLSLLLLDKFATVSVCHIGTSNAGKLEGYVKKAEVLVVAVGKPELIKGAWIKKDAIVIDVGINKAGDKTVGDVEFLEAQKQASWITPVPGGVGPLTVMMLMRNLVEAVKLQL